MSSYRRTRVHLSSQVLNIIRNVTRFCEGESSRKKLRVPLSCPIERASLITGVSFRTLTRLRKPTSTQTRRKRKPRSDRIQLDSFDQGVMRRAVKQMYDEKKHVPTHSLIHSDMKARLGFRGSMEQMRRILKELGFKWKKCATNRNALMERPDVIQQRIRYLKAAREAREECRHVVYMDETYVNSSHTMSRCWQMWDGWYRDAHTIRQGRTIDHSSRRLKRRTCTGCRRGF